MNKTVFYYDSGEVHIENQGEGKYTATVIPDDPLLPTESHIVKDDSLLSASQVLSDYKEKYNLNPSTVWNGTSKS